LFITVIFLCQREQSRLPALSSRGEVSPMPVPSLEHMTEASDNIFSDPPRCGSTVMDDLDDLLELEDGFYQEGFDAGVADSEHAGLVEGKIFGIEKGYDKVLDLGRLHGRALVWQHRLKDNPTDVILTGSHHEGMTASREATEAWVAMESLPKNSRLDKNIQTLLALTAPSKLPTDNSDESVEQVEDALSKSKAKSKIISATTGETMGVVMAGEGSIEDSLGLSARH
jgi:hypothetical protein